MQHGLAVFRLPQVCELTGLARSTIYAAIKAGSFPAPFPLGPRAVGWSAAAVEAWLEARTARKPDSDILALVASLNGTATVAPSSCAPAKSGSEGRPVVTDLNSTGGG